MEITVSGRKMPVSESLRKYAEEKIGKSVEHLDVGATSCDVVLHVEKNKSIANKAICEVTVLMPGHVARVQESEMDMYAAIDVAAAKISRQLRKFKTRIQSKKIKKNELVDYYQHEDAHPESELDLDKLMESLQDDEIVRRKKIHYSPMTEDEAMLQMDLLGHDFFVYTDKDSGKVHVLYRRTDGSYGLLTPHEDD